jgi:uncharacterized membrane protein YvbJ
LVYCTKCGTENKDDADTCLNCGASLHHTSSSIASPTYRPVRRDRREDDICFGGRSNTMWPLIIGAFIILIGLSSLLEDTYAWARFDNLWPLLVIGIGLIIVVNALQRR